MSKAVLMSIQPKWCELIASGKKTVEVRKSQPKIETPFKVYIYQTKKTWIYNIFSKIADWQGKVIGEFICNKITDLRDMGGSEFFSKSCMTYDDWRNYTNYTNHIILAWHISNLVIYDEPKELSEFIKPCDNNYLYCEVCPMYSEFENKCYNKSLQITRPPQSWCYVKELRP